MRPVGVAVPFAPLVGVITKVSELTNGHAGEPAPPQAGTAVVEGFGGDGGAGVGKIGVL